MSEAIVITPVKDSPDTTLRTIEAVSFSKGNFDYYVYNDFSQPRTKNLLNEAQKKFGFHLVHLEEITSTPSPNYKLVLEEAQRLSLTKKKPLIIVESDVIVKKETFGELLNIAHGHPRPGLVGAITTDEQGHYNFPYNFEKIKNKAVLNTPHSLSFCCTLLTLPFLESFDFKALSGKKDWFDVTISRQSKKSGFINYLAKGTEVIHLPHSSRPWKKLKYKNPILYYFRKLVNQRDRI